MRLQIVCLLLSLAGTATAQPTVGAAVNAASNIRPGLPNSGIAKGSMFIVYGTGLGPNAIVQASYPLPTDLSGTSVSVSVEGTTMNAIMVYTLASQVAAILPSSTPSGSGTIVVTYNGRASAPAAITVVQSNVAMYTLNQAGTGAAVVTLPDYSVVTPTNAANPGETVVFWATGLGPVQYDETRPASGGDMIDVPLEAFIGGTAARVTYRGRNSCCTALDQINVEIPQGVVGCVTSVIFKIGSLVSNAVSLPVADQGRICLPTQWTLAPEEVARLRAKQTLSFGSILLGRLITTQRSGVPPVTSTTRADGGSGLFWRFPSSTLESVVGTPSYGSCVGSIANQQPDVSALLDAGAWLTVDGPSGMRFVPWLFGVYSAYLGDTTSGNYLDPGSYTITGGGSDVGPFTARVEVPPTFNWTNQVSTTTINRASGVTLTWTGGDPDGYLSIQGNSNNGVAPGGFLCTARAADGSFTIPPAVLLALPASDSGTLTIGSYSYTPFEAAGLDLATAATWTSIAQPVAYE